MSWNQDRLVAWIVEEFRREQGIDLSKDKMAMQRVKEAAEKTEIELKSVASVNIKLPFITADASGPKHLSMILTRTKFEQLIAEFAR
jgi:molecular chaperone DnaK